MKNKQIISWDDLGISKVKSKHLKPKWIRVPTTQLQQQLTNARPAPIPRGSAPSPDGSAPSLRRNGRGTRWTKNRQYNQANSSSKIIWSLLAMIKMRWWRLRRGFRPCQRRQSNRRHSEAPRSARLRVKGRSTPSCRRGRASDPQRWNSRRRSWNSKILQD